MWNTFFDENNFHLMNKPQGPLRVLVIWAQILHLCGAKKY
jgi:hypothetical protein